MAFQGDSIFWVEVEKIVPNPFQPRREFDEDKLKELAESVRMYGILQPLTVTRKEIQNEDGSFRSEYELIAGERRLRASKMAGVAQVPVIIREGEQSEQEKLELAIIENLQREDLNAVDRAIAFRQLADVFGLSHSQVAKKMGRSREYVSNSIRLLALPDYMLTALRMGDISEGHCRALLMLNDRPEEQDTVFRETLLKKLSVRDVERISRGIATEKMRKKNDYDADLLEMEKKFTETLGTRVSITKTEFGGRLSIDYFTQEDLEEILEGMRREAKKVASGATVSGAAVVADAGSVMVTPADSQAEALATLTERTGLELVPEKSIYTPTNMPKSEWMEPSVNEVPSVMSETASSFVPLPVPEIIETPEPTLPVPDHSPAVVTSELVIDTTAVKSPSETWSPSPQPEVSAPAVPNPATENVVHNHIPAPTPVASSNSLRDQLASLMGNARVVVPAMPNSVPSNPAPVSFTPAPAPVAQPSESIQRVIVPAAVESQAPAIPVKDESDLYSIRDFSI
ncbi:MAG: ParB/RepB/Spo0J family partition protein [Patescibacteria group bacterium]